MKRALTGIQPTGQITLGNYIGAISKMVQIQNEYDSFIFVADLHAITIPKNPQELRANVKNLLALYLACGIDVNKNTIYLQSDIHNIPYISWLLECNTYYGELSRMTQFKDKSAKNINFTSGLLTYPVLMTADIVAVDSDIVPVGIDQKQHVELARDISERFNKKYGKVFVVPEPYISNVGAKICDLQNPEKKMSKSAENEKGVIRLLDPPEQIRKKIMSATTDSEMRVVYNPEQKPGISNLITIYSCLSSRSIQSIEQEFIGANYGTFKTKVADVVVEKITEIQEKYNKILNSETIDNMLKKNAQIVNKIVDEKCARIKDLMGLGV